MGTRRIALAATAVLATGLALTACSSTSGSTSTNAAGGAAASASTGTSAGGSTGGGSGNGCSAADLRVSVLGPAGYANDQQPAVATVHVVNVSSASCTLYGYPGIKVADDQDKSSPITATRVTGSPVTAVTVKPGQGASAELEYNDINTQGTATHTCGVQGSDVQVILPDTTTVLEVKVTGGGVDGNTLNVCDNALSVQPFEGAPA